MPRTKIEYGGERDVVSPLGDPARFDDLLGREVRAGDGLVVVATRFTPRSNAELISRPASAWSALPPDPRCIVPTANFETLMPVLCEQQSP